MSDYVLELRDLDRTQTSVAGGKGANLGELSRIDGIVVPDGFCVSTRAFARVIGSPELERLLARLRTERHAAHEIASEIRAVIETTVIPDDIQEAIAQGVTRLGEREALAVRSSATAEDLPTASFAGQHDTYLNVAGTPAVLEHIRRCWASLFTERAVTYRDQNGFDHRDVQLAVVVQKMVAPSAAGVLFTADPITSSRKVSSIDAVVGLGEALVAGHVNADTYKVRDGQVVAKTIATTPVLTDDEIARLEQLGRTIEAHFGEPQDIEWCLVDGAFSFVQSRPITTLFPIPIAKEPGNRVYVSVGHQQMMTDAMRPLGLSMFLLTTAAPMVTAGGRLFVDVTRHLATPAGRDALVNGFKTSEPLLGAALATVLARENFLPPPQDVAGGPKVTTPVGFRSKIENDPAIVTALIERIRASTLEARASIEPASGSELFDRILEDIGKLKKQLFDPQSSAVYLAAMDASAWLNENMKSWLGETNAADTLTQSVPNNVTSEMGLALLDVADVVRPYPDVIAYLQHGRHEHFLDGLATLDGGARTRDALVAYLDMYGMRCPGEIDITNTRWIEDPSALVPLILNNLRNFEAGASRRRFEHGKHEAAAKERELVERLKQLPDGEQKADETRRMISLVRNYIGYREYPKYGIVSRYLVYKRALLAEAQRLVGRGVLGDARDIYFLTFEELHEVARTSTVDAQLVARRKALFRSFEKLTPPRVITSDGDVPTGTYTRADLPAGALPGLAVSSGIVEGRARILVNMSDAATLEDGDILVTVFTDPSWTPLFVSIKGLVTEVGGLMTHGAVIAREYGLPAVVAVENATTRIADGQRIRVHGTDGYVELL